MDHEGYDEASVANMHVHEGMPFGDDSELNEDDTRRPPVKRKRALNSSHGGAGGGRCVSKPVNNPNSLDANHPKPCNSLSDREPSSMKCRQITVHIHRGSSLRQYKWWVRSNRVVFRGNLGQEYANGRKEDLITKGQLSNKGVGGKIRAMKEKVSPQGSEFRKHPCSSKQSAEPERSIY